MIRTDKMHQWASTQMAAHDIEPWARETPDDTMLPRKTAKWPLEDGRYPEAGHAAIDWDDEPGDKMTLRQALVWWWPAIAPALGLVMLGLAAVYWSEIAAFLGVA